MCDLVHDTVKIEGHFDIGKSAEDACFIDGISAWFMVNYMEIDDNYVFMEENKHMLYQYYACNFGTHLLFEAYCFWHPLKKSQ